MLRVTDEEEEKKKRRTGEKKEKEVSLEQTYAFFLTLCSVVK